MFLRERKSNFNSKCMLEQDWCSVTFVSINVKSMDAVEMAVSGTKNSRLQHVFLLEFKAVKNQ